MVSLDHTFIDQMEKHGDWPPYKPLLKWLKVHYMPMRRQTYPAMRKGEKVDIRHIVSFSSYLFDCLEHSPKAKGVKVYREHLRNAGISTPTDQSPEALAELLIPKLQRDYLANDLVGLQDVLSKGPITQVLRPCKTDSEVEEAVRWFFISIGQEACNAPMPMAFDEAIQAAEEITCVTLRSYQAHAVGWWKSEPWTVGVFPDEGDAIGMSIVLPLRERSYHSLRNGKRMAWQVKTRDICQPSRMLQIEAFAPCPLVLNGDVSTITEYGLISLLSQAAALSYMGLAPMVPRHALAPAATTRNKERLISSGYSDVQRRVLGTKVDVLEKIVTTSGAGFILNSLLDSLRAMLAQKTTPYASKPSLRPGPRRKQK